MKMVKYDINNKGLLNISTLQPGYIQKKEYLVYEINHLAKKKRRSPIHHYAKTDKLCIVSSSFEIKTFEELLVVKLKLKKEKNESYFYFDGSDLVLIRVDTKAEAFEHMRKYVA